MNYRPLLLLVFGMLLMLVGAAVQAQDSNVPAFASVEEGTLILSDALGATREVFSAYNFQYLSWNADGTKLAFILRDSDYIASLGVVDATSGEVTVFSTERLEYGFNLNWTLDGRILFATYSRANDQGAGSDYLVDIQAVAPETGSAPDVLGTFAFGTGCGGGSPIPADHVYSAETSGFRGFFLTLADTPYGIVHSVNCGGVGIGLLNPVTGESTPIVENFAKVIVSPDGNHAAGLELNFENHSVARILIYDLNTQEAVEVAAGEEPDQLAWSQDGESIYYSIRMPDTNLLDGLTDQQRQSINEMFGTTMEALHGYTSSIHRADLVDQTHKMLYEGYAYAIGRIAETDDALYFSQVPNLDIWLDKLLNGEVQYDDAASAAPFVEPAVLRLAPQESTEAVFLGWFDQFTPVVGS